MAKLGEIIIQIRGVSYSPQDLYDDLNENSVLLLRANNIQNGNIVLDDVVYVSKSKVSEKQYLKSGDILICTSSGSRELVGKAAFIKNDMPITFGAFCKVVRPVREYEKYIGYFFQSPYYRRKISELSAGANINNIRNEHIENLEINLPPLEEQRHIAAVLDKVTDLIAQRRAQLDKLDLLVKSRFVEMFGNETVNATAEEVCETIVDCPHSTPKYKGQDKVYPAIRTSEIKNGQIDWTTMLYVDIEEYKLRTKRLNPLPGDIVYAREGTYGDCVILPQNYKFCLGQRTMLFRPNYNKCTSEYLHQALRSEAVKRQADESNAGSTVPHVNVADAKKFTFPLPTLERQKTFSSTVQNVNQIKNYVNGSLEKLETLKKSLMQQYFGRA